LIMFHLRKNLGVQNFKKNKQLQIFLLLGFVK
jgi:hypothetical protein